LSVPHEEPATDRETQVHTNKRNRFGPFDQIFPKNRLKVDQGDGTTKTINGGVEELNDIEDVNAPAPDADDVLTWDNSAQEWIAAPAPGAGGGEANTASNVGTGEGEVFKDKSSVDLRLRTLKKGKNIEIATDTDEVEIEGASLSENDEVNITSPTDGQVLTYHESSGKWINASAAGGGFSGNDGDRHKGTAEIHTALASWAQVMDETAGVHTVGASWGLEVA
jgi:hypothetical protein